MKKLLVLFCLFAAAFANAQAPQYLNYQGVARDAGGTIISTPIGIKFEILQGSPSGTTVYEETNNLTPSAAGIFTAAIGNGVLVTGNFPTINWAGGPYFIRVSMDPAGGTSYSTMGTSQLLSVPYALYAEKAGNTQTVNITGPNVTGTYPNYTITAPGALTPSTGISISSGTITNTAPDQTVTLVAAGISSVTGTYPSFTVDVPPPALGYNSLTNVLSLTQGTAVTTTTLVGSGSNTVSMFASGIATVNPVGAGSNFTVSVQTPTLTGAGSTTVSGTYPNFLISTPLPTLAASPVLQINPPHSTSTISANNFSINIVPTTISGPGVIGTYPNYTVTSSPSTSIVSGGSNVIVNGSAPSYTISASTPTIQINAPNTVIPTGLNNYSINIPPVNLAGAGVATVSGTYPTFTLGVSAPTITASGNTLTIAQGTAVTTTTFSAGPWATSGGVLYPAANPTNDKVAIGQTVASANLDVVNAASSTNTSSPVVYINNANTSFGATGVLHIKNSTGGGAGVFVEQNNGLGDGISVNVNNTSNSGNAFQVQQFGIGNAGFFSINNISNNSVVVDASTNGLGTALSAVISNTSNTSNAIYASTSGQGAAGYFNKSSVGYGLFSSHNGPSGAAGFFNISGAGNSSQALTSQTSGSGDAIGAYNIGNGRALYASNTSSAEAVLINNAGSGRGLYVSSSSPSNESVFLTNSSTGGVLLAQNNNASNSGTFFNTGSGRALVANNTGASETMFIDNSGTGRALFARNANSVTTRAALIQGGLDITTKTSGTANFGIIVTNTASTNLFNVRDDGNVGIGVSNPGYRLSVFDPSNTTAAIYGSQGSAASSSGAHGVFGLSSNTNTFAAGVHGENTGSGPAISSTKTSASGPAARFEITNATNTADGLFATTNGFGAAIHAVNGPTVSGGSNAAVWLESGHLKSTQLTAPTTNTISVSGGGISGVSLTLGASSTDVKGVMNVILTTTLMINSTNNAVVRVNFNKMYQSVPVVVVTSLTDLGILSYYVTNVTTSSFNLVIRNSTSGNMSSGASFPLNFNYMVIE